MKVIEKIFIFPYIINLITWGYINWEEKSGIAWVIGVISLFIAYFLVYAILRVALNSYAVNLINKTVNYLNQNHQSEKVEFTEHFHRDLLKKYTGYIFLGFLILDWFLLINFRVSMLSLFKYI